MTGSSDTGDGAPFAVGIDLGTTNSAVASVDLQTDDEAPPVLFATPQLVGPGVVEARPLLPSFVYLPGAHDLPEGATQLPWCDERPWVVGDLARSQGMRVPGRLVGSAKSWLCHQGVDRGARILPWGGADDLNKLSPVEAAARVLGHIREAWNHEMAGVDPAFVLEQQDIVLTVPASFDQVARELTLDAARSAGLERVTLVEEPQAAFYCWMDAHEGQWSEVLPEGGLVLVCDIGGGTTDLSLIAVSPAGSKGPGFERLAVGRHLLLGGDNVDLGLARWVESGLGATLDARQWIQLALRCRDAKETLLGDDPPDRVEVVVPGSGTRLVGGAVTQSVEREPLLERVLEGFLPLVPADAKVMAPARSGFVEFGLPYEPDAAITRHILDFVRSQRPNVQEEWCRGDLVQPTAILFNGGTTEPLVVRERIVEAMAGWYEDGWSPVVLHNERPSQAVALGAAHYGAVRRGRGTRISGGSARAYFVGVEGEGAGTNAICVLPHGLEEGREVEVADHPLRVLTNQPVAFDLWSSSTRTGDAPGELVVAEEASLTSLPPLHTLLHYGQKGSQEALPITLVARITEVGTLELGCASTHTPHRWKLAFDLRADWSAQKTGAGGGGDVLDEEVVAAARRAVEGCFLEGTISPAALTRELETALGLPRADWPLMALRSLWPVLRDCARERSRSEAHEARWLNLVGYGLRPGFGQPGDEIRIRELWKRAFGKGIHHARDPQVQREWWVMWRRAAGGLSAGQQVELVGHIQRRLWTGKDGPARSPDKALVQEMWMAAASLERIEHATRRKLGKIALKELTSKEMERFGYWVLGRLGSRQPVYAGAESALPVDVAVSWLEASLERRWKEPERVAFEVVQLARYTGDRVRDLPRETQERLKERLRSIPGSDRWLKMLDEEVALDGSERQRLLADSLPRGLQLG